MVPSSMSKVLFGIFPPILKNPQYTFVGNLILCTSYDFGVDDVTMTSFVDIKYGNVAVENIPHFIETAFCNSLCQQNDLMQMPFTLKLVQCMVTILRDQ